MSYSVLGIMHKQMVLQAVGSGACGTEVFLFSDIF
jgi:hypothetical protein